MLATLAIAVSLNRQPVLPDPITLVNEIQAPDFDKDVVLKLKALQPENEAKLRAAEDARKEAERKRLEAEYEATRARLRAFGSYSANSYGYGQCTYYIASRIALPPFLGNANAWAWSLPQNGWRQSSPVTGAIAVSQWGWAGHVAIVERVDSGGVYVSEMNYAGWNVISYRYVNPGEFTYFLK